MNAFDRRLIELRNEEALERRQTAARYAALVEATARQRRRTMVVLVLALALVAISAFIVFGLL